MTQTYQPDEFDACRITLTDFDTGAIIDADMSLAEFFMVNADGIDADERDDIRGSLRGASEYVGGGGAGVGFKLTMVVA